MNVLFGFVGALLVVLVFVAIITSVVLDFLEHRREEKDDEGEGS